MGFLSLPSSSSFFSPPCCSLSHISTSLSLFLCVPLERCLSAFIRLSVTVLLQPNLLCFDCFCGVFSYSCLMRVPLACASLARLACLFPASYLSAGQLNVLCI